MAGLHIRRQIRDRAISMLTGLPTTGANVFASRVHPLEPARLPAICIYTLSEESSLMNMGSVRHLQRNLDLIVECVTAIVDELDDTLDAMAVEVETVMAADQSIGGLTYDAVLTSTRIALHPQRESERPTGSAILTYRVTYRTRASDPTMTN